MCPCEGKVGPANRAAGNCVGRVIECRVCVVMEIFRAFEVGHIHHFPSQGPLGKSLTNL